MVLFYAVAWLLHEIIANVQDLIFFPFINNTIRNLQLRVVGHLHKISFLKSQHFENVKVISALKRISLATRNFLRIHMLLILPCGLKIVSTGILIFQQKTYGFAFLVGVILVLVSAYGIVPAYGAIRKQAWKITDDMGNTIAHSLFQPQSSRTFYDYEIQRLKSVADSEFDAWLKTNNSLNFVHIWLGFGLAAMVFFPLVLAVQDYASGTIDSAYVLVLQAQLILVAVPMRNLMTEIRQLVEATTDMSVIQNILCIQSPEHRSVPVPKHPHNVIEIDGLSFGFTPQNPVLHNIQVSIAMEDKILLLGSSGMGKSTFLNIVGGVLHAHEQVAEMASLTKMYIPQKAILINDTLRQNLTYGLAHVSKGELAEVLSLCELEEVIEKLPDGLDSMIHNLGSSLSEGERQRILIARSMLQKPDLLIMDEALDSLDWEKRDLLYRRLWQQVPTILWTSHDQQAHTYANRMWHLSGGKITDQKVS